MCVIFYLLILDILTKEIKQTMNLSSITNYAGNDIYIYT